MKYYLDCHGTPWTSKKDAESSTRRTSAKYRDGHEYFVTVGELPISKEGLMQALMGGADDEEVCSTFINGRKVK